MAALPDEPDVDRTQFDAEKNDVAGLLFFDSRPHLLLTMDDARNVTARLHRRILTRETWQLDPVPLEIPEPHEAIAIKASAVTPLIHERRSDKSRRPCLNTDLR